MVKSESRDVLLVERDEKRKEVGVFTGKQPFVQVGKSKEFEKPTVSGKITTQSNKNRQLQFCLFQQIRFC